MTVICQQTKSKKKRKCNICLSTTHLMKNCEVPREDIYCSECGFNSHFRGSYHCKYYKKNNNQNNRKYQQDNKNYSKVSRSYKTTVNNPIDINHNDETKTKTDCKTYPDIEEINN